MTSFKKQLIDKLWDDCFDLYIQMRAEDAYLSVQEGQDIETAKRDYSKMWEINTFFPSPIPQKYIDSFQEEYLKKVDKIFKTNNNGLDIYKTYRITEGMQDAYRFALSVNVDKIEIQKRLNFEDKMLEYRSIHNEPDVDPNSTSFLLSQGRMQGLNQILKMLREKKIDENIS